MPTLCDDSDDDSPVNDHRVVEIAFAIDDAEHLVDDIEDFGGFTGFDDRLSEQLSYQILGRRADCLEGWLGGVLVGWSVDWLEC